MSSYYQYKFKVKIYFYWESYYGVVEEAPKMWRSVVGLYHESLPTVLTVSHDSLVI